MARGFDPCPLSPLASRIVIVQSTPAGKGCSQFTKTPRMPTSRSVPSATAVSVATSTANWISERVNSRW
ncbi:MAG: hypothetical protein CL910_08170 [Deltaproteobacteria bacterium]|nr:hypothetical protein [Deltaproteobacteria bacterium]